MAIVVVGSDRERGIGVITTHAIDVMGSGTGRDFKMGVGSGKGEGVDEVGMNVVIISRNVLNLHTGGGARDAIAPVEETVVTVRTSGKGHRGAGIVSSLIVGGSDGHRTGDSRMHGSGDMVGLMVECGHKSIIISYALDNGIHF